MKNFNEFPILDPLLRAITELGYTSPTPIQAETLPLLLGEANDFLGLAATGTGKTAAFGIPLLQRMDRNKKGVQAVILCPTRELAIQVAGQIDLLGKYLGIKSLPIYGGTGYGEQIHGLKSGNSIVVGTPGRVVDHIRKGTLKLQHLKTLVLDEADEMISMGFQEELEAVLDSVPEEQANIWLFSATMAGEVRNVANAYLKNPKKVQMNAAKMLSNTVEQIYYKTQEHEKPEVLSKIIDAADDFYGIIFCQTKALVSDLHQYLVTKGYRAECLHGDLDQNARDRVMKSFRNRKFSILVATDVACRGLDVKDITHVINYSIPRELDNYVHRIGRTARSGKQGLALSLVTNSHRSLIDRIEKMTKSKMKEGVIPSDTDIAQKKIITLRNLFETKGPQPRAVALIPDSWKQALQEMSGEEIAGRFISLLLPDLFVERKKAVRMQDSRAQQPEHSKNAHHRGQRRDRDRRKNKYDRHRNRGRGGNSQATDHGR